jgi:hypothetical protein
MNAIAKLYSVNHVHLHLMKSNPPSLVVSAIGAAPSSGWTDVELGAWIYITPPADGIQDFDLLGRAPSGVSLPVLTPVAVSTVYPAVPKWLKGVRIHASSNKMEALLSAHAPIEFAGVALKGGEYWPWSQPSK